MTNFMVTTIIEITIKIARLTDLYYKAKSLINYK